MKNLIKKLSRILPDKWYIQLQYFYHFHRFANLKNPQTFNEKLNWLKLHDHNPLYTTLVDKYAVKKWVADKIGEQYIIPTLGVWERAEDIDFDSLPHQFVLKCNHSGGGNVIICRDKAQLDKQATIKKLSNQLKHNNYWYGREWPYKNVLPRIIAEKYMEDNDTKELRDYKIMCFNGKVKCSFVCSERFTAGGLKVTFYDTKWKMMPFERHYPRSKTPLAKPLNYDEMVTLAEKLAKDISFVRVDFYSINEKTYFGEMTYYPGAGLEEFTPSAWDAKIGNLLILPKEK